MTLTTETYETETARLFVPDGTTDRRGVPIIETFQRRAANNFGGFTTYDGAGGWMPPNGDVVTEDVTVIEVLIPLTCDVTGMEWAKANLRFMARESGESVCLGTVDGRTIEVSPE